MKLQKLIDTAASDCMHGSIMERKDIIRLLDLDPLSEDAAYARFKADEAARRITGNKAYLWGAMGIDFTTCAMDCDFCSFGKSWDIVKEDTIYDDAEIAAQMKSFVDSGVHYIVMRTTEFYSVEDLCAKVKKIRASIPGNYELILNIGEFDYQTACMIHDAGTSGVYHALRLREGIDTRFDPEVRRSTMMAASRSPLKLISLIEPVGPEHTSEEIADNFLNIAACRASLTGTMARVPVPGTPLGDKYNDMISNERIAQLIAVIRLAAGSSIPDICVHPASDIALKSGANVTVVETGAIPRDDVLIKDDWKKFTADKARTMLENAGYEVRE